MKRMVFSILMMLALVAGATFAQSTINTTAPGPTQQLEPGQTNNNLPNPGNPVNVGPDAQQPVQEQGTVEGTAAESINDAQGTNTTGTMPMPTPMPETETGTGVDVDVDTGSNAAGAVDVDVNSTTDADTDASGVDETGSLDNETNVDTGTDTLPGTASALPLLGLVGLLALAGAFAVRRF